MGNERAWINRILFATDFSLYAYHVEEYAAVLAKAYGAIVDVLHVLESYPGVYAAVEEPLETDGQLHEVVRRLQLQMASVNGRQLIGRPSVQICEAAMRYRAGLIVMGTHGRTGLDHLLLGSTAERVVTMAPCPVLTVGAPNVSDGRRRMAPVAFDRVLVPVDFSGCSLDALEYGIQIAKDFGAALTLLHVLEPGVYDDDESLAQQDRFKARIDSQFVPYLDAIRSAGISVREEIRDGDPADTIRDWAFAKDCDIIVMGTHGRRGLSHVMWGGVAQGVLRRAPCPVLAVRNACFAPDHEWVVPMARRPGETGSDSSRSALRSRDGG